MSNKGVKLAIFLKCSVHIFIGNNGCLSKNNLRILWNYAMAWSM